MARRSMAAMVVTPIVQPVQPPDPPESLTESQKVLWRSILLSKPSDWFDAASLPLLTALVVHMTAFNVVNAEMERYDISNLEDLNTIDRLGRIRDRESKQMAAIATKLRLTCQSRYTPERARNAALRGGRVVRPWEVEAVNPFDRNGRRQ